MHGVSHSPQKKVRNNPGNSQPPAAKGKGRFPIMGEPSFLVPSEPPTSCPWLSYLSRPTSRPYGLPPLLCAS